MFELGTPETYLRHLARQTRRGVEESWRAEQRPAPTRTRRFRRPEQL